jgi:lipopolysaccharide transport system ATP-binding protein
MSFELSAFRNSMSDTIISVENVGKRYALSHRGTGERYTTLRDVVTRQIIAPFKSIGNKMRIRRSLNGSHSNGSTSPSSNGSVEDFWALKDVSFEVKQGDVIGIIGRNGAGKSTLLKILSRITEPTEGRIRIKGRVASLLEVGTGFHPELTGRENIYLNGSILGMSRAEIKAKFDEIVAFAEVERFLDTPVKRFSSGMYVRLAFAIAAHLDPEILIVDEVLAVGDTEFQKKCLGKMGEISQREGRTVLFVSHNLVAVQSLCRSAVILRSGQMVFSGDTFSAIAEYNSQRDGLSDHRKTGLDLIPGVKLNQITVQPRPVRSMGNAGLTFHFEVTKSLRVHKLIPLIYNQHGRRVAIIDLFEKRLRDFAWGPGQSDISIDIAKLPLVEGSYEIGLNLNTDSGTGDFFGLYTLVVAAANDHVVRDRISAVYRGDVELEITLLSGN